jgi:DNA-binding response OmpR family regulator
VVLVVEDEPGIADELTETLARSGYATIASHDAKSALETALLIPPDMVVIDVALEGTSGFELANSLRERLPDCIRVMFSRELPNSDLLAAVNAA